MVTIGIHYDNRTASGMDILSPPYAIRPGGMHDTQFMMERNIVYDILKAVLRGVGKGGEADDALPIF